MIVRPATDEDIAFCNEDLKDMEFPSLPEGYVDFLKMLNGFAWNGIEFYSTDQVTDEETGYILSDIVSANVNFGQQNDDLAHCLQLGRSDEDVYVYNTANEHYEVLDRTGRDVMEEYDNFETLFTGVVAPRI